MEYHIDAQGKALGRIASEAALILQGKKSPAYEPREVGNDKVIIENVRNIVMTGKKRTEKIYYRHTGYMGHLKEKTFAQHFEKNPEFVVREAVRRMLPKNFLNKRRLKNLVVMK